MKRPKPPPLPNYVRKLRALWRSGAIPREAGLHLVTVYHDDWCGIYAAPPQGCNCDPEIRLKATGPGSLT